MYELRVSIQFLVLWHMKLLLQSYMCGCNGLKRVLDTLPHGFQIWSSWGCTGRLLATQLGPKHILTWCPWRLLFSFIFRGAASCLIFLLLCALFGFLKIERGGKTKLNNLALSLKASTNCLFLLFFLIALGFILLTLFSFVGVSYATTRQILSAPGQFLMSLQRTL